MLRATADEEHDRRDDDPLRLEHALGREWNVDDTKRVFMRMNEEIQEHGGVPFAQSLTKHQRDALLHREIREDIEDFMAARQFGGEWDDDINMDILFGYVLQEVEKVSGGILLGYMQSRVCRGDEVGEEMCTVCQDELYLENERIGTLEGGHEFHLECIAPWLQLFVVCPLCRSPNALGLDQH